MSSDMMTFPATVEEFMEQYKIIDSDHVYTNGTELVPIFRMKQWFEHSEEMLQHPCQNCPNNPKNGGSGICHCVLGTKTIY